MRYIKIYGSGKRKMEMNYLNTHVNSHLLRQLSGQKRINVKVLFEQ